MNSNLSGSHEKNYGAPAGLLMAYAIDAKLGRRALTECLEFGVADFFLKYQQLATQYGELTKFDKEVIEMLQKIQADGGNYKKWVDKAKDKSDPFKLMGFGHRVYKNFDPRAKIIKKACDDVLNKLGINDPILDLAKHLEEVALNDEYFVERKLYPNVDFYSGIIYKAIGIPTEMFTVMFALGRLPGWIAQWKEMIAAKEPIGRPRQIYTGETERNYVPIAKR